MIIFIEIEFISHRAKEADDYYRCLALAHQSYRFEQLLVLEDDMELEDGGLKRLVRLASLAKQVQGNRIFLQLTVQYKPNNLNLNLIIGPKLERERIQQKENIRMSRINISTRKPIFLFENNKGLG